jgi:hypothetical protein
MCLLAGFLNKPDQRICRMIVICLLAALLSLHVWLLATKREAGVSSSEPKAAYSHQVGSIAGLEENKLDSAYVLRRL